ncbi:transglycosylase domain-containing protein [Streptomyces sp. NPDC090119]|uniref:transglycosylase domain-containing protein n=1 Tax=Streptomyces sp. NPDC090119 TaxID=3365951 RepID=UPI00380E379E
MPKKRSGGGLSATQQAAKFLGVSVLAGAVMAGIALPAAGALGLAAKGSVQGFDEIPANLKSPQLSQRTTILDSRGNQMATVYSRDRTVVELKDISPYMQKSIVAIEDSRFYQHGAIDLKGVLRALNKNAQSGGVAQGASTLTQQLVKNYFIEEAGDDPTKVAQATQQTLGRKVRELKYAIQIEEKLGKKKILENYLNITFFGEQAYGVEAAAQRYFSKPAKDLNLQESALLAGIVQSPSRYDPVNDEAEATKRRNTVLQRMAELGDISQAEADRAGQEPLGLHVSRPKNGCITATRDSAFFCKYVENVFLTDPVFGKTREERAKLWNKGGLTIRTTLDPQAQKSLQDSLKDHVYKSDSVAAASTLVQPGTGKVLAMGQSKPFGYGKDETEYNFSVDRDLGGSNFGFPTGSTFKPFVAAAAIEGGKPPTQAYSAPYKMNYPSPVQRCGATPYRNTEKETVENENESEKGPYRMKEAMAKSVNTYFVQLISDIGLCPVAKLADKLHVVQGDGSKLPQEPSIALGAKGLSPLTMANAYATFAARGMYCSPVSIESITEKAGDEEKSLPVPKSTCSRAMSEKTADTVNTLLRDVIDSGTGQEAGLNDRDSAGKTGTTDGRKNAWFVGYTPNMSGAVWVGSARQDVKMMGITIGGTYHDLVFGGGVPGPIWRDAMSGALVGKDAPDFNTIDIPDEQDKGDGGGNGRGDGNGNGGRQGTPGGGLIGGLFGGLTGGNGGNGGNNGGHPGAGQPKPTKPKPGNQVQGNANGGRRN